MAKKSLFKILKDYYNLLNNFEELMDEPELPEPKQNIHRIVVKFDKPCPYEDVKLVAYDNIREQIEKHLIITKEDGKLICYLDVLGD